MLPQNLQNSGIISEFKKKKKLLFSSDSLRKQKVLELIRLNSYLKIPVDYGCHKKCSRVIVDLIRFTDVIIHTTKVDSKCLCQLHRIILNVESFVPLVLLQVRSIGDGPRTFWK